MLLIEEVSKNARLSSGLASRREGTRALCHNMQRSTLPPKHADKGRCLEHYTPTINIRVIIDVDKFLGMSFYGPQYIETIPAMCS
jgi:hypothetical protein